MEKRIYCLVPPELAGRLHELLRDHFREDPGVEVVVDRRVGDRRSGRERRRADEPTRDPDRRRIHSRIGRRVGERRAAQVAAEEAPPIPRRARRYAARLRFVERLEPAGEQAADLESGRLVVQFQAGEVGAFTELYLRYFEPVYAYVRVGLREHHAAEDLTQQVFTSAFAALADYELRPGKPFRAWLFKIARNEVLGHLRKHGRLEVEAPDHLDRRRELGTSQEAGASLDWASDADLMLFIERLPEPQRRALVLRYMIGLSTSEIAAVLDRSPAAVRKLEHRALRFLEKRLAAIGRGPRPATRRAPSLVRMRRMTVARARRYALGEPGARARHQ